MTPPRILFVNQHYAPDLSATSQRLTDLAEHLAERGFRVEVLCSRGDYLSGPVEAPAREARNGVKVRRVPATGFGRDSLAGRITDYLTFHLQVLRHLITGSFYDDVVFLTTPPLLSVTGRLTRALRGIPYGVWSMDVHPEIEQALGYLDPDGLPARALRAARRGADRAADFVVALGPHMAERLCSGGVPDERIETIPIWADGDEVRPVPREENPLVGELGLEDRFVVAYSGNAGKLHEFGPILEAMRRLRDDPKIYFLFVGSGDQRERIERFADEHGIRSFSYRDYFPRDRLAEALSVAHVHLVSLRSPFAGLCVPSKTSGIMAAGRPVLFLGPRESDPAEAIRGAECGTVVDPARTEDPAGDMVGVLRGWRERPAEIRRLGRNGRRVFEERYSREAGCREFEAVIEGAWG